MATLRTKVNNPRRYPSKLARRIARARGERLVPRVQERAVIRYKQNGATYSHSLIAMAHMADAKRHKHGKRKHAA